MPAVTLADLGLETKSPQELEALRRDIVSRLQTEYRGYNDPNVPMELLNQLAVVTGSLRRKNAGPPKTAKTKAAASKTPAQTDDFVV